MANLAIYYHDAITSSHVDFMLLTVKIFKAHLISFLIPPKRKTDCFTENYTHTKKSMIILNHIVINIFLIGWIFLSCHGDGSVVILASHQGWRDKVVPIAREQTSKGARTDFEISFLAMFSIRMTLKQLKSFCIFFAYKKYIKMNCIKRKAKKEWTHRLRYQIQSAWLSIYFFNWRETCK